MASSYQSPASKGLAAYYAKLQEQQLKDQYGWTDLANSINMQTPAQRAEAMGPSFRRVPPAVPQLDPRNNVGGVAAASAGYVPPTITRPLLNPNLTGGNNIRTLQEEVSGVPQNQQSQPIAQLVSKLVAAINAGTTTLATVMASKIPDPIKAQVKRIVAQAPPTSNNAARLTAQPPPGTPITRCREPI